MCGNYLLVPFLHSTLNLGTPVVAYEDHNQAVEYYVALVPGYDLASFIFVVRPFRPFSDLVVPGNVVVSYGRPHFSCPPLETLLQLGPPPCNFLLDIVSFFIKVCPSFSFTSSPVRVFMSPGPRSVAVLRPIVNLLSHLFVTSPLHRATIRESPETGVNSPPRPPPLPCGRICSVTIPRTWL